MNYNRDEIVQSEATMNQMRNAIYHLQRFMKNNGIIDIRDRLMRMGENMGQTYVRYYKPIDYVNMNNLKDVIATLYKSILNSTVSIDFSEDLNQFRVKDNDCALCKYQYEDINVAGCEITVNMVSEIVNIINKELGKIPDITIEPMKISESRSLGDKSCIHTFKIHRGEL